MLSTVATAGNNAARKYGSVPPKNVDYRTSNVIRSGCVGPLEEKIQRLDKTIRQIQNDRGNFSAQRSIGDSGPTEAAGHDLDTTILNAQLNAFSSALKGAIIVDAPTDTDTLQVGQLATIFHGGRNKNLKVFVGGLGENDPTAKPPIVSYTCPMLLSLMGLSVGDSERVMLPGGLAEVQIVALELPPRKSLKIVPCAP